MGLTLTIKDFALVFTNPRGIILGELLQFGLMPLIAFGLGHLFGYYEAYPFVFVGMILVMVTPGGVTSNLMTYYAKGDLALSISMTSIVVLTVSYGSPRATSAVLAEVVSPSMMRTHSRILLPKTDW